MIRFRSCARMKFEVRGANAARQGGDPELSTCEGYLFTEAYFDPEAS